MSRMPVGVNRWMTPVDVGRSRYSLTMAKPVLLLGSCFADSIGKMLIDCGFSAMVNPLGTTYNPASVANSLERIATCKLFGPEDCVQMGAGDGRYSSFYHHTRNARPTIDAFLADANCALEQANDFWQRAEMLIVTLGTAWVYKTVESQFVVSNCLKLPSEMFSRERLSLDSCVDELDRVIRLADGRDVIFTVSPIRHLADGAHGNQLSKSTLLMAVDLLLERVGERFDYFPSYEILLDELRDYRFYAEDMAHPSKAAEQYVFDRFMDYVLQESERDALAAGKRRAKASAHIVQH